MVTGFERKWIGLAGLPGRSGVDWSIGFGRGGLSGVVDFGRFRSGPGVATRSIGVRF